MCATLLEHKAAAKIIHGMFLFYFPNYYHTFQQDLVDIVCGKINCFKIIPITALKEILWHASGNIKPKVKQLKKTTAYHGGGFTSFPYFVGCLWLAKIIDSMDKSSQQCDPQCSRKDKAKTCEEIEQSISGRRRKLLVNLNETSRTESAWLKND